MKRLTNAILPIRINGVNLENVSRILFKFRQGNTIRLFEYPSDKAFKVSDDVIGTRWSLDDTEAFLSDRRVSFDTQIWVKDSENNLETQPGSFQMVPSLFTREEVDTND